MTASIFDVNSIYDCSARFTFSRHFVSHPELKAFCRILNDFKRRVNREGTYDDYWDLFLRPLQQYIYNILLNPLPFNHSILETKLTYERLKLHLIDCAEIYPQHSNSALELLVAFLDISNSSNNPQLDFLLYELEEFYKAGSVLALKNNKFIPVVEEIVGEFGLENPPLILSFSQLRQSTTYNTAYFFGPISWLPTHVITAPRAREAHIVIFDCLYDNWKLEPIFLANAGLKVRNLNYVTEQEININSDINSEEKIELADLQIKLAWQILSETISGSRISYEDEELVQAKLLLLENDAAVFVEDNSQESVLIIDLDADTRSNNSTGNLVKRVSLSTIEPGVFILLRTSGGGDYIITIADKILGSQAPILRQNQEKWKISLRKAVQARGALEVSIELLDLGSQHANEVNLRNWMSPNHIRPFFKEDFNAILKFAGLEDQSEEYFLNSQLILSAHRKAGFRIRDLLLQQISQTDLTNLAKLGRKEFSLPGEDGGSFTAIRVVQVDKQKYMVSESRLGELLDGSTILWHG
jgi:hypothetical protein